jgi:1,4-alpha-glucan branching enzyme
MVVSVVNMTPVERTYRLGLPAGGHWAEILNTDAAVYGGGNRGNLGGVTAEAVAHHGRAQSALVTLPPLSALWLKQD